MFKIPAYILKNKVPVRCKDTDTYVEWLVANPDHLVAKTEIGETEVSTTFTGIPADPHKPDLVFETIIRDNETARAAGYYASWTEAEQGHQVVVDQVRQPDGNK